MYGLADGHSILGVVNVAQDGGTALCLGLLDPAHHLRAIRTACGLQLPADPEAYFSPGRRGPVVMAADPVGGTRYGVIDLDTIFDQPALSLVWDAGYVFGWIDATTLVVTQHNVRVAYRIGEAGPVPFAVAGVDPVPVLVS